MLANDGIKSSARSLGRPETGHSEWSPRAVLSGLCLLTFRCVQDCCHPGVVQQYGPAQFFTLAKIHAIIRKVDPYHLVFGTVACRVMWMWKDSYGSSGLGLDVTMAEAYVRSPTHYLPFLCTGVCCGVLQL